ncbi:DNA-directed RNA polymerase III subunit RPC3 [Apiospora saccharicola]|uniref:DNA-directed RNA polymerase III subunit RPC3 n=1 Tax=Apiospora saccharicola TaxID=335842 RepID=A0ABR1W618_9PEZI
MSWQVTKNAAELCVLLIRELYGQLPSRIFEILMSSGRSTVQQLARISSTGLRHVRHGLAVLVQQNLVYHYTDSDNSRTIYEANHYYAYNIVRNGKILDCVHRNYGEDAKRIVHLVMASGHMRVGSIVDAYLKNHGKIPNDANGSSDPSNGHVNDDDPFEIAAEEKPQVSGHQILDDIAHLIAIGILEPLSPKMLQSPEDIKSEVDKDLMKAYPSGLRGKQKGEHESRVVNTVREIRNRSQHLKMQLEPTYLYGSGAKRRKLANRDRGHGFSAANEDDPIEDTIILRVNYEKCLVELRNQRLCQFVDDHVGYTTAQVYGAMLAALSKKLSCCQPDPTDDSLDPMNPPTVTTIEIFEYLKASVDVFGGIGKPSPEQINVTSAEKVERQPPSGDGDGDEDVYDAQHSIEDPDNDADVDMEAANGYYLNGYHGGDDGEVSGQNGTKDTKVTFADKGPTKAERMQRMRQHLLILAESGIHFVRHSGTRDQGEWTVDFEVLIRQLRFLELDTIIEDTFGREGLRLIKILRAKGKIDDKTLPTMALMQKGDVHMKMVEMELAGFLDVQEVPRDNNRVAARTLFLWFFDEHRTLTRTLDNTYKAMVRHLQRLEVESQKKKNILSLVERTDVQGMEEEKLNGDAFNEYQQYLDIQSRLLGQVSKLDDLVSVLRDY